MIYLVRESDKHILDRVDAWASNGEEKMRKVAKMLGYVVTNIQITMMGDMIIWVA